LTSGRLIIDDARDYLSLFQIDRVFGLYGIVDTAGDLIAASDVTEASYEADAGATAEVSDGTQGDEGVWQD